MSNQYKFQHFNDPKLQMMLRAAEQFRLCALEGLNPRWISFCGPSGIGKTHLASALFDKLQSNFLSHPSLICGAIKIIWPRLLLKLRDGDYWRTKDIADANLILLDDFGTERPTEFALEKLYEIIESRARKWTILTCNLSMTQIAQKIDTRLSSRMIRNGSIVVDMDVQDFGLRNSEK